MNDLRGRGGGHRAGVKWKAGNALKLGCPDLGPIWVGPLSLEALRLDVSKMNEVVVLNLNPQAF